MYLKVKLINHDCLPISMLLYIMLYVVLAYLMLFAALYNAVYKEYKEVGRLWRCLDLLEVTSMSYVLLSLSLSMFAVAQALTSLIHDCIE